MTDLQIGASHSGHDREDYQPNQERIKGRSAKLLRDFRLSIWDFSVQVVLVIFGTACKPAEGQWIMLVGIPPAPGIYAVGRSCAPDPTHPPYLTQSMWAC